MSTTKNLADHAISFQLSDMRPETVEFAQLRILDTVAVAIGGSTEPPSKIFADLDADYGSTGPCSMFGLSRSTSPMQAAVYNGICGHALDYDDQTFSSYIKTSATIVPPALALAELGNATGKAFLEAYIVGFELSTRIGWGAGFNTMHAGWHPNGVIPVMGAAAGGVRLLGGNSEQVRYAIGIAASSSSGIRKNVNSMTKSYHVGHASGQGLVAAQLAIRGFTSDPEVLDQAPSEGAYLGHGHFSWPQVFIGEGKFDLAAMERGLGSVFALDIGNTNTRFHPSTTFTQTVIDEVLELVERHKLEADQIQSMSIGVTPHALRAACWEIPTNVYTARFSLPFTAAVSVIDKEVTLRQFTDARMFDPKVHELILRIKTYVPDELANVEQWSDSELSPASCIIDIVLYDGRKISGQRNTTRGLPGTSITWKDMAGKFEECAEGIIPPRAGERFIEVLRNLPDLKDINQLSASLRG